MSAPVEAADSASRADAAVTAAAPAAEPASPARKRRAAKKAAPQTEKKDAPQPEAAKPAPRKAAATRKAAAAPADKAAAGPKKVAAPAASRALPSLVRAEVDCDVVRDSFTMPQDEYEQLDALKRRALALPMPIKKSELLRAGLKLLASLDDADLAQALAAVPLVKTGRPKGKGEKAKRSKV
ncbi:MAG: hypothetical protein KA896_02245 [Leptothrix sp. (in: Bacteria)]|nr:hypothetical protein [Leptothrix sp. (in: b-proteobacteria)]